MGGSATTATIIQMAVVFIATHPYARDRFLREIDEADEAGLLSPVFQYKVVAESLVAYMILC